VSSEQGFERMLVIVKRFVIRLRRPIPVVAYLGLSWAANILAFLLRFDGSVPADFLGSPCGDAALAAARANRRLHGLRAIPGTVALCQPL
jgi:hypothetical protein